MRVGTSFPPTTASTSASSQALEARGFELLFLCEHTPA